VQCKFLQSGSVKKPLVEAGTTEGAAKSANLHTGAVLSGK